VASDVVLAWIVTLARGRHCSAPLFYELYKTSFLTRLRGVTLPGGMACVLKNRD